MECVDKERERERGGRQWGWRVRRGEGIGREETEKGNRRWGGRVNRGKESRRGRENDQLNKTVNCVER